MNVILGCRVGRGTPSGGRLENEIRLAAAAWMAGLVTLDVGDSLWSGEPVFKELFRRMPLTIELGVMATLFSLIIAIPTGVIAAVKRGTWMDYASRVFAIIGLSIPIFWVGVLSILGLVTYFNWTPPLGYVGITENPWVNFQQLIWAALALGYIQAALVSRMTRSSLLEVLREDCIHTARSKGVKESGVIFAFANWPSISSTRASTRASGSDSAAGQESKVAGRRLARRGRGTPDCYHPWYHRTAASHSRHPAADAVGADRAVQPPEPARRGGGPCAHPARNRRSARAVHRDARSLHDQLEVAPAAPLRGQLVRHGQPRA